jgi:hypothetical protein
MNAVEKRDRAWRKSRVAARLLMRRERGPLMGRNRRLAQVLARDPEVTNRLIQQALFWLGIGDRKHEFDRRLVDRWN